MDPFSPGFSRAMRVMDGVIRELQKREKLNFGTDIRALISSSSPCGCRAAIYDPGQPSVKSGRHKAPLTGCVGVGHSAKCWEAYGLIF